MIRSDTHDIIHTINYAALCIAILRPTPVTVEDAFELYEGAGSLVGGRKKVNHQERVSEMAALREAGYAWREIGEMLGLQSPMCYFSRYKYLLQKDGDDDGRE
jgi:hypothetical protein